LQALDNGAEPTIGPWTIALNVPSRNEVTEGEITDLPVTPGMTVEAGSLIARIVDFRKALVRMDIPMQALPEGPPKSLKLEVLSSVPSGFAGPVNRPEPPAAGARVEATLLGVAPQHDAPRQFAGYLYGVENKDTAAQKLWRPGLFVKSTLFPQAGKPVDARAVPASAVLFHQGRALVYVRVSTVQFRRYEVRILGRVDDLRELQPGGGKKDDAADTDFYIVLPMARTEEEGLLPRHKVVTRNAQLLLSEEFRRDMDDDD
jgi:hypothetical protein